MAVTYIAAGNIVDDAADVLVNTVNTVGVMGKGVALAFKQRWPQIMTPYRAACRTKQLRIGRCVLLDLPDGRKWAALATKDDWRNPSQITWVRTGLFTLAQQVKHAGLKSIAIPPPGCGNGGLDWAEVHPLVLMMLKPFDLRIYAAKP